MTDWQREEWWPTVIWATDIPYNEVNPETVSLEAGLQAKREPGHPFTKSNSWTSSDLIPYLQKGDIPETQKLVNWVQTATVDLAKEMGLLHTDPQVNNLWFNVIYPMSFTEPHHHRNSAFSAVYYAQSDLDSGDFVMNNPSSGSYTLKTFFLNNNRFNFERVVYKPTPGKLLIMPSWVLHWTGQNRSSRNRISVGMDLV